MLDDSLPAAAWDAALAALGGHPLQSAMWGHARRHVDGIADHRLAYLDATGAPAWMIRVEARGVPVLGRVAWAPRGPTATTAAAALVAPVTLSADLRARGLHLLVSDPYVETSGGGVRWARRPRTIWVDLSQGAEVAFSRLKGSSRTAVRKAARNGVTIAETTDAADIAAFIALCRDVSRRKRFRLDLEAAFVDALFRHATGHAGSRLFAARHGGAVIAAALVLTLGRSWHYFWGGVDHAAGPLCAGNALQWAIIEAAVRAGAVRYDLEGVDDAGNPSTAAFKRTWGGKEVELPGHHYRPLGLRGHALATAMRVRR